MSFDSIINHSELPDTARVRFDATITPLDFSMSALEYRPAIDGLRAVAVISVLVFHLNKEWLPGGFVGVDIFFVISGYLITSIIFAECESKRFHVGRFYQRRISRIYPQFCLVAFLILLTARVLYLPQDYASAGAVATAAAFSVTNLKLMLQGSYFDISLDAQPLLHFWSLAVEEQFYLVLPFLVYAAYRLGFSRRTITIQLIFLAIASFVGCILLTKVRPAWAFYLLPTRAWELLGGSVLAASSPSLGSRLPIRFHGVLADLGMLILLGACFLIGEGKSFPGSIAAVPVLGTMLFIAFSETSGGLSQRALSHPVAVFIGKISYALYLWHWPVYCFVDYSLFASPVATRLMLKLLLTLLLTGLSFFTFEQPLRRYLNHPTRMRLSYAAFAVGVIVLAAVGISVRNDNYLDARLNSVKEGGVTVTSAPDAPRLVLMGDSNGSMYGTTIRRISKELRLNANIISVAAGDPFPESRLFQDSLEFLTHTQPTATIFAAAWADKIGDDHARLEQALAQILEHSQHVILITQPPQLPPDATRDFIRKHGLFPIREPVDFRELRLATNKYLVSLNNERIHVVDLQGLFNLPDDTIRYTDSSGRQLYQDHGHLSAFGCDEIKSMLIREISRILAAR